MVGLKGFQYFRRTESHSFLEVLVAVYVQSDGFRGADFHAVLAIGTMVKVNGITVIRIKFVGIVVAAVHTSLAMNAQFFVPFQAPFQAVDLLPCSIGNASHGDVFACTAVTAYPVSLHVGKVDHDLRVVDVLLIISIR
jgi:hypothetical protein